MAADTFLLADLQHRENRGYFETKLLAFGYFAIEGVRSSLDEREYCICFKGSSGECMHTESLSIVHNADGNVLKQVISYRSNTVFCFSHDGTQSAYFIWLMICTSVGRGIALCLGQTPFQYSNLAAQLLLALIRTKLCSCHIDAISQGGRSLL